MTITAFFFMPQQIVVERRFVMARLDVREGALVSVDLLVGLVLSVERNGIVPSALIAWENGSKIWMPLSEMQSFVLISKAAYKNAA
jgi:hypothetical protein